MLKREPCAEDRRRSIKIVLYRDSSADLRTLRFVDYGDEWTAYVLDL